MQCLLPHWAVVQRAREAKGMRCFIGHVDSLLPFASVILAGESMPHRLISADDPCVADARIHARLYKDLHTLNPLQAFELYPKFPMQSPMAQIQADVARNVARTESRLDSRLRPVILMVRRGGMRRFDTGSEDALFRGLSEATGGRRVVKFSGDEGIRDTLRLFVAAAGVVGYHGAGFANTVFNGRKLCAVEITTTRDRDCTNQHVWRSHQKLKANQQHLKAVTINKLLLYRQVVLPLRQMLMANYGVAWCNESLPTNMDHFVKHLNVSLNEKNIVKIAETTEKCLKSL